MKFEEKEFIRFLEKQRIVVKTNTKARGYLGIYKRDRIDISIKADKERRLAIFT